MRVSLAEGALASICAIAENYNDNDIGAAETDDMPAGRRDNLDALLRAVDFIAMLANYHEPANFELSATHLETVRSAVHAANYVMSMAHEQISAIPDEESRARQAALLAVEAICEVLGVLDQYDQVAATAAS